MTQLQSRYPAASLIAEFVTIHQESFVVRALVQAGGITLSTGMAAAVDIEQAEDRAKIRALAALGIGSLTASIQPQPSPSYSFPSTPVLPVTDFTASESPSHAISEDLTRSGIATSSSVPSLEPALQESLTAQPAPDPPLNFTTSAGFTPLPPLETDRPDYELPDYKPDYEIDREPESYEFEHYGSEPEESSITPLPNIEPAAKTGLGSSNVDELAPSPQPPDVSQTEPPKPASPTGKGKSAKRKTENTESAPPTTGENDRSAEIAKIGLEMKRLGWTTEQGRNYLKRTYGKRSRQELDDAELIDFLRYLEAQISPSESSLEG